MKRKQLYQKKDLLLCKQMHQQLLEHTILQLKKLQNAYQITTRPVDISDPDNPKNKIDLDAKIEKDVTFEINGKKLEYLRM